jgi:F0F1-type ATP synthase membrane subunit c/vacuolar-type H+-ATPase subunit K
MSYYAVLSDEEFYLAHHGIKGQKWGVRRWQNDDGTLTEDGKKRYGTVENYQKSLQRKKIARYVGAGVGITAAAAATGAGIYVIGRNANFNQYGTKYDLQNGGNTSLMHSKEYLMDKAEFIKQQYKNAGKEDQYKKDQAAFKTALIGSVALGSTAVAASLSAGALVNEAAKNKLEQQQIVTRNNKAYYEKIKKDDNWKDALTDDNDYVFNKGHIITRITTNKKEAGQGYDMVYANPDKQDSKLYKSILSGGVKRAREKDPNAKKYERRMQVNEQVTAPSGKKMLEITKKLTGIKDDKEAATKLMAANRMLVVRNEQPNDPDVKLGLKIIEEAKKQGYNAIPDLNDRNKLGKSPLILLDPDKHTTDLKINQVGLVEQLIADLTCKAYTYDTMMTDITKKKVVASNN